MANNKETYKLMLVDDEADFRKAVTSVMTRRGFDITEASRGEEALALIIKVKPDIVILDLNMPGLHGIDTLQEIRKIDENLPVIILTGHGDYNSAMAGIKLDIVDFLQKPVDLDLLAIKIKALLDRGHKPVLREKTVAELMVSPEAYPRLNLSDSVSKALQALKLAFFEPVEKGEQTGQVRSALVYDKNNKFYGIIRFNDLLRLLIPPYLMESPYSSFFTGMFLAQCKVFGSQTVEDLVGKKVFVDPETPLMEAVYLMVRYNSINLPVMKADELVGILRGRDVILDLANNLGSI